MDQPMAYIAPMVVAIVFLGVVGGIISDWLKTMRVQAKAGLGSSDVDIQRMQAEIDQLKERVHILEKLATDEERGLRDEFRRLA